MLGSYSTDCVDPAQSPGSFTAAGVASPIRSKRLRSDNRSEVSDLESVNCIAQRLAEMSSPLSYKRLCTAPLEAAEAMEVIANTADALEMNCEVLDASKEIGPSGNLSHGQAPSRVWSTSLDSKQALLPWPNLVCTVQDQDPRFP